MILTALSILALAGFGFSLYKTQLFEGEFIKTQKQLEELQAEIVQKRQYLRKKLNRNLILQKQIANEPIPTVTYKTLDKKAQALLPSDTIYSLAEDEGFGLTGTCEGNGDCGLCAIQVLSGKENLNPINEVEQDILNKFNYPEEVRLCCQTRIKGDVVVDFFEGSVQT